ncbi:MAG: hypothetical protein ACRD0O_11350, partial [Acidimicrobiia bacterium]
MTLGWKTGGARYGLPTGEAQWASVNGWIYYGPQIPLTPDELEQRQRAAATTLRSTPWRDEVRRWHDEERPRVVAANRRLQAEDPGLPAVVGVPDVFEGVHDGDLIEVDP